MWQALMDWLPDLVIGTLELRDVMNIVLALVGVILAGYAVKMGFDQDKVTAKQMEIMEGQKALLEELGKLEKKQTEIAEQQHQMTVEQHSRKAEIEMECIIEEYDDNAAVKALRVFLYNHGSKAAKTCDWELYVECDVSFTHLELRGGHVSDVPEPMKVSDEGMGYFHRISGHFPLPIFQHARADLGTIIFKRTDTPFAIIWNIDCEDGRTDGARYINQPTEPLPF